MRTITGGRLCLLLLAAALSWPADAKKDARKSANDTVWSQPKTRRLFARRKIQPPQENRIPKYKLQLMVPARRCSHLMESCSSLVQCCDPCASCHCRLFNTICHCWRLSPLCLKRT